MSLFKKAMLAVATMVLALVAIVVPANKATKVEAATNDSNETWSAIGTINGTNWNTDFDLVYDSTDDRYELQITLNANEEFKVRYNHAWSISIGYGSNTGSGIGTYLSDNGGNFKVKTSGVYLIWVKDDNVRNYGDKSYGFGIEAVTAEYFTITHYAKDGSVLKTEEVVENSTYVPAFAEIEGYRLEGWYTDSSLTTKLNKGTVVTSDLDLYPNYVEATDYVVYVNTNGNLGTTVNAYMWRDEFDGGNNATWPGVAATLVSENLYSVTIDASQSYSKIIFNDGTNQTSDLDLTTIANSTYVLDADLVATIVAPVNPEVKVGYQVGTKDDAKALRLVAELSLTAADLAYFYSDVQWRVTFNEKADTRDVTTLYSSVNPMNGEEVLTGAYYAVLTYVNVPAGDYTVELLVDGVAVTSVVATVA